MAVISVHSGVVWNRSFLFYGQLTKGVIGLQVRSIGQCPIFLQLLIFSTKKHATFVTMVETSANRVKLDLAICAYLDLPQESERNQLIVSNFLT